MRKLFYPFVLCFVVTMQLTSCGSDTIFNESKIMKGRIWNAKYKPKFEVNISDTSKVYDLILTVRTTADYSFANMWMYLHTKDPKGNSQKFPLEIIIADPSGEWKGDKSGSLVSFSKLLMHDNFNHTGTYTFTLEQATTQKELPEVVDITLDVFASKSEE